MPSLCHKPDPFTIFRSGVMGQKGGPQYSPKRSYSGFLSKNLHYLFPIFYILTKVDSGLSFGENVLLACMNINVEYLLVLLLCCIRIFEFLLSIFHNVKQR